MKKSALRPLVVSLFPLLTLTAAEAQNAGRPIQLPDVAVTATRILQPVDAVPIQTIIISRQDIDEAGSTTLVELLQRRAGLEIRPLGGVGQPSGVFIRGANSQHTLLLVDGLRVGSVTAGSPAFENIPLDLIERIEVVKGPLSGVYGSDAIGGVVQVFTRNSDKSRLLVSAGGGNEGAYRSTVGFTAVEADSSLSLQAGYQRSNAVSASNAAAGAFVFNPDRDPYTNTHATLKLTQKLWQGELLTLSAWASRGNTHFDSGPGNDATNRQTLSGIQLSDSNQLTESWRYVLTVGQTRDESRISSDFPGVFETNQNQLLWQNEFGTVLGTTSLGFERVEQRVTSSTTYTQRKRATDSAFAGISEQLEGQSLSANLRYDREDQFGNRTTGAASYGLKLSTQLSAYISAGRAFRAPSFNDLYFPGFSNPLLKAERSSSREVGLRQAGKSYNASIVYFDNRIDDLIVFDFVSFLPQNLRRARIKGLELQADTRVGGVLLKGMLTLQQPEDADSGRRLRSRARQFGSISAQKTWGKWELSGDVFANGWRFDSNNEAPATRMGGYVLLNASARYRLDKKLSLELSGQNLADRRYELAKGYNPPGRAIFAGVRVVAF